LDSSETKTNFGRRTIKLFRFAVLIARLVLSPSRSFSPGTLTLDGASVVSTRNRCFRRAKVRFFDAHRSASDEGFLDFTTGDKEFWIIKALQPLLLHPGAGGIRRNLNLVTASGNLSFCSPKSATKRNGTEIDLKVFVTRTGRSAVKSGAFTGQWKASQ